MSTTASGYALRQIRQPDAYYETNGLGDWTLCGTLAAAELFESVASAEACAAELHDGTPIALETMVEVVHVVRTVAAVITPVVVGAESAA